MTSADMAKDLVAVEKRSLTTAQYGDLADVPPELEWLPNTEYLALAGHGPDAAGPVFRPVTNNRTKELEKPLNPNSIYRNIILKYGLKTGVSAEVNGLCVHSLRATAAANALSH